MFDNLFNLSNLSQNPRHENGLGYAVDIIEAVENRNISTISDILESFELGCGIRQYSNAKAMNLSASYFQKGFGEVKENIQLFIDKLKEKIVTEKTSVYKGEEAIYSMILSNMAAHKISHTYNWLEQMRYMFMDCIYDDIQLDDNEYETICNFFNKDALIKKYLKLKHLKNTKFYLLPIYNKDRYASKFFYNNVVCAYNWRQKDVTTPLHLLCSGLGSLYSIPVLEHGANENTIKLHNLKQTIIRLSGLSNLDNEPDEEFFADMFCIHTMIQANANSPVNHLNMLGYIITVLAEHPGESINAINTYFENIVQNNMKISGPVMPNPLSRFI